MVGEECSRPCCFGVMYDPEVSVFGVVGGVSFCTEGKDDWVRVDDTLGIEGVVECVVKDVWDGPCTVDVLLWSEFIVLI